jgi:Leucine-rich repeat (LRR) protein
VESLSAKDNLLEEIDCLSNCVSLRCLKLDSNHIASLNGIAELPKLTVVTANTNYITCFPKLNCPKLQRLELYHNFIRYVINYSAY